MEEEKEKEPLREVLMATQCSCENCFGEANWVPVLVMNEKLAKKTKKKEDLFSSVELDLPICDYHRTKMTINDVLTPEAWKSMTMAFAKIGKKMPSRKSITLDFKHVELGYPH